MNNRSTGPARRAVDMLYLAAAVLAGVSLVAMAGLVAVQIVARLLQVVVNSTDDFAGYALAAVTFLALPYTFRSGGHVRVSLLLEATRGRVNRGMEIFCLAVSAAVIGYFAYFSATMTVDFYRYHNLSSGVIPVPLWIPQTGMSVGLALLFIAIVDDLVTMLRGRQASYQGNKEAPKL